MSSKTKTFLAILVAAASATTVAPAYAGLLDWGAHFDRMRSHDRGGVWGADGAYGVVFPLAQAEPNARMTPGVLNPAVSQASIGSTICVRGYTRTIRPEVDYTERLKHEQIAAYGYSDRRLRDYEEDHLISLELGGSPTDPRNLWPEPHHVVGGWGSYAKDRLENKLHRLVCRHKLPLADAQSMIAHDWIAAYKRYVGPAPNQARGHRYDG